MSLLDLSIALDEYDHTQEVTNGRIPVEGVRLLSMTLPIEEIFYRFAKFREFDIAELSMGKYVSLRSQGDDSVIALPVFISRAFRHSSIYVADDSPLKSASELAGKRIGIPEWAQTASIYSRGMLAHEFGVPLSSVDWVQAGVNQAGRVEKVALKLPADIRYRSEPGRSLDAMLRAGEIDAALTARPPVSLGKGIRRLIPDYRPVEEAYYRKTGIYPIMHVLVMRGDVFRRHPWVAMNLFKAFSAAKDRSVERMSEVAASHAPMPWLPDYTQQLRDLFGPDFYPYGLEPNRRTLEAFLQYAFEQGVCHRKLEVEELFPKEVLSSVKV
jgi:4,5-dihydroxyphthalate decarboxylase